MKKALFILFSLLTVTSYAQNLGYEMRTNGKSYLTTSQSGFELRHRTDLQENRVTYRYNIHKENKLFLSVPLHYKIEKHAPTLEPRLVYHADKYSIWVQQEFWYHEWDNTAVALDISKGNMKYRIGWDTSKTVRFRLTVKI
jgi:hypothetical protein